MRPRDWAAGIGLLLFFAGCAQPQPPLPTVSQVELERYQGTWYEIARYENRFERGCVGASAEYRLEDDHVRVTNRCFDDQGELSGEAQGRAYVTDAQTNARLEVTFFWPFYGDYWILLLDPDYRYSVVGEPQRRYFWILSRTPTLPEEDLQTILARMPSLGYDPALLHWTRNPEGNR